MALSIRRLFLRFSFLRTRPLTVAIIIVVMNLLLICLHQAQIIGISSQGSSVKAIYDSSSSDTTFDSSNSNVNRRGTRQHRLNSQLLLSVPIHKPLLIFTILKEFGTDEEVAHLSHDDRIRRQISLMGSRNAVRSWVAMSPNVSVLLFADTVTCLRFITLDLDDVTAPAPLPPGRGECVSIPCFHETIGAPTYDCLFAHAKERAIEWNAEYLMYANADMVFFADLLHAVNTVSERFENFLVVGHRYDIDYNHAVDFNSTEMVNKFLTHINDNAILHGRYGLDYFLFRTRHTPSMPPFLVGRIQWDNWLLSRSIRDDNIDTVEVSSAVLAVHQNHGVMGVSHDRSGTNVNRLLAGDKRILTLGALDETDYKLLPFDRNKRRTVCPACRIQHQEQSLDVMLYKHSSDDVNWEKTLLIASVNYGYLDFAMNWYCSLMRVGVQNFIFHAMDEIIYAQLRERGMPAVLYISDIAQKVLKDKDVTNYDYGSVEYQALMNSRTDFIFQVLKKNYHVVLCDVDIVVLKNPFHYLDFKLDIHGQQHKTIKVSGGFLFLRATDKTKGVWRTVLRRHRKLLEELGSMKSFDPHSNTEQSLLNKILLHSKQSTISWGTIGPMVISDGKRFFIDKLTQKNGEWPAAIHNNYIIGKEGKRKRFELAGLWFVNENLQCSAMMPLPPPPPEDTPFSLAVKVITFNRPMALQRLLDSLKLADYDGDSVSLDIFIDRPVDELMKDDDTELMLNWRNTQDMARKFKWDHGEKNVIVRDKHYGLAGQWLHAWRPDEDDVSEIAIILEDDNVVAPLFYQWLRDATKTYFYNYENYDGRMYGISLQKQHMIAGRYPRRPVIDGNKFLYRYQLGSTWGPVFFPAHWREFCKWFDIKSIEPGFQPLFSQLITNKWYLQRGGGTNVWSAWFIRFAAERGWYSLYTNFKESRALVVNYRDAGNNFQENQGPNSAMVETIDKDLLSYPPLRSLPLYDFHFNLIHDPSWLEGRAFFSDNQEYPI